MRIVRAVLRSWQKYKHHPDARIRARFAHEAANLPVRYAGVLWAARQHYRDDSQRVAEINRLMQELFAEFGWRSRLAAPIAGRFLWHTLRRQQRQLDDGWTYEPPTFYETNDSNGSPQAAPARSILVCSAARNGQHKPASEAETTVAVSG